LEHFKRFSFLTIIPPRCIGHCHPTLCRHLRGTLSCAVAAATSGAVPSSASGPTAATKSVRSRAVAAAASGLRRRRGSEQTDKCEFVHWPIHWGNLAVDGDSETRWQAANNNPTHSTEWLAVDLGAPLHICSVSVTFEDAYSKQYELQLSNDGRVWTTQATVDLPNYPGRDKPVKTELPPNVLSSSHVRLHSKERGLGAYGISIYEMDVTACHASCPPPPPSPPPPPPPPRTPCPCVAAHRVEGNYADCENDYYSWNPATSRYEAPSIERQICLFFDEHHGICQKLNEESTMTVLEL